MSAVNPSVALQMPSAGGEFERVEISRRDLDEADVQIEIKFVGLCHTDVHQAMEGLGRGLFPMVPGHEIAGVVSAIGPGVTRFSVGDQVGVGCFVDSCGQCEACRDGEEQFCAKGPVSTYNSIDYDGNLTYGGYSERIVVCERFVVRIPDELPLTGAAPLLCAGITLFSPLRRWNVGPHTKVAIIGLGGLGHMGVQLAHAMGAEVTVLSQTERKRDDALLLGADHYYATGNGETFQDLRGCFDMIVNTAPTNLEVDVYLSLLRPHGVLLYVGAPPQPESVNVSSLLSRGRSVAGSMVGGPKETQEMLEFCAEHGVIAQTEIVGADEIDNAYKRMLASEVRYRFVMDIATLRPPTANPPICES